LRQHFGIARNALGTHNAPAQRILVQFALAQLPSAWALDSNPGHEFQADRQHCAASLLILHIPANGRGWYTYRARLLVHALAGL
jgi:hypothetical protein